MYTTMFRIPRSRNPFLRVLGAIAGVLIVAAVLVFGFFIALALVAVGAIVWAVRQFSRPAAPTPHGQQRAAAPPPPPGVIEGEFTVVRERSDANKANTP